MNSASVPTAHFRHFETLWFQIAGTLCNLRCSHCFISCAPDNHRLEMMETAQVIGFLEEAKRLGVKEIYYTGGEPFIHRDFLQILEITLRDFPATVLTNGLLINETRAARLHELAARSPYSLELRISLDDHDEQRNDAVRGKGTFRKVLAAMKRLDGLGFLPILAVSEIREYHTGRPDLDRFRKYEDLLRQAGIRRPRIKIIPVFEMGMLPLPDRSQYVTHQMMESFDDGMLQCSSSRIVAQDGVYACPILVGEPEARMSTGSLQEALHPCQLFHTACTTCYVTGMTCKNY